MFIDIFRRAGKSNLLLAFAQVEFVRQQEETLFPQGYTYMVVYQAEDGPHVVPVSREENIDDVVRSIQQLDNVLGIIIKPLQIGAAYDEERDDIEFTPEGPESEAKYIVHIEESMPKSERSYHVGKNQNLDYALDEFHGYLNGAHVEYIEPMAIREN